MNWKVYFKKQEDFLVMRIKKYQRGLRKLRDIMLQRKNTKGISKANHGVTAIIVLSLNGPTTQKMNKTKTKKTCEYIIHFIFISENVS